jgi:pyruvate formate lyase activating enzyme
MISRREFLINASKITSLVGVPVSFAQALAVGEDSDLIRMAPRARYWDSTASVGFDCWNCHGRSEKQKGTIHKGGPPIVKCQLCARACILRPGERGKCQARINHNGELRSLVYGHPVSLHVDPIEKKPFYHFLPGSEAFSLATAGCPLRCKFCQNWQISQSRPEDFTSPYTPPAEIVRLTTTRRAPVIAFTYNEPTVFMEYLIDIASLAKKQKLRSVMVSCGYMNSAPLKEMCSILDAIKIDLKGYSETFYRNVCSAELRPVLDSIRQISKSSVHLELVNLVVPTLNDSDTMLSGLVHWIMGEIGPDVPIHFTRFHPDYQLLNLPPTPVATLERFRNYAMSQGIRYAYIGNVPNHPGNHTYCPQCGKAVIRRNSIFIEQMNLERGKCKFCGSALAGVWN